ncbi:MAG: universal stress protein [Micropruina sp.]|uniref:universal stress protein n=1 Tax=Micropruina sp. TaxID=2737536 RepID=UPI0039E6D0DC
MSSNEKKIVVGVDGSEPSLAALRWAADAAGKHGCDLVVLKAWLASAPPPTGPSGTYAVREDASQSADVAQRQLLAAIGDVLGEDPPIVVLPVVREGNTAKLLIDASASAEMLVVGTRGLGGFAGLMLGSVSQHVAVHAACTVVIVR